MKRTILFCAAMATVLLLGNVLATNTTIWNLRNTANTADVAVIDEEGDATFTSVTATGGFAGPVAGAVAATTLSASEASTLSGSVTVIGGGVTSRWDNTSGKIDTAAIETGALPSGITVAAANITADSVGSAAIGTITQSDTNATTTATLYTPAFIGQVLIGGAGTGTNGVWISKGLTTNDWVVVAP